jgi:phenylalanyl-tRNA synthetase beta chain
LLYGSRHAAEWPWQSAEADYLDLKGHVEHLVETYLKLSSPEVALVAEHPYLNPCVEVRVAESSVGFMGKVREEMADYYHARKDVWLAELDLDTLRGLASAHKITFAPLPVFPPSRRDVTVIGPVTLKAQAIRQAIVDTGVDILESVQLVAEFIPEDQPEGKEERNLSFRLTYRHPSKTLKDKQVDKEHAKVLEALTSSLPVRF